MSGAASFGESAPPPREERAAPSLAVSLIAAVGLAVVARLVGFAAAPWLYEGGRVRLVVVTVASVYAFLLSVVAPSRSGKVVLGVVVALAAAGVYVGSLDLLSVLVLEGSVVWLVRTTLFARSIVRAGVEAMLVGAGLFLGVATYASTHSVATAVWAAMLVQAAGAFVPTLASRRAGAAAGEAATQAADRFDRAHRAAESALAALATKG